MTGETFTEAAAAAIEAGARLLWVETAEVERAISLLEGLAHRLRARFEELPSPREPAVTRGEPLGWPLHVVAHAHRQLADAGIWQVVWRVASAGPDAPRGCVVLVTPVGAAIPEEFSRLAERVALGLPDEDDIRSALRSSAPGAARGEVLEALIAACRGLTAAEIHRLGARLQRGEGAQDPVAFVLRRKQALLARTEGLEVEAQPPSLDEVGGLDQLKAWLEQRRSALEPAARAAGLPRPRGVVLVGVQGCGKSLTARAVAGTWRWPLVRLDVAALFEGGDAPEGRFRRALMAVEALAPLVLWLDEVDKAYDTASVADARLRRILGTFLVWLQHSEAPVFVAATANQVTSLPPEFVRRGRFDEIFFVDLPGPAERRSIFAIHLRHRGLDPATFDLEELARRAEHFSGAEIEQVVVAALFSAFEERRAPAQRDVEAAIERTVPLFRTYEDDIKALRQWARTRARPASSDTRVLELFR